jgi:uncharacterized protein YutE (UPF0331/DUF86 family)
VIDQILVLRKLTILREHISRVRRRRPDDVDAFRDDTDRQDAMALSLLVAIQEALDIAMHVCADEGWGIPASYAESFEILAKNGLIDDGLAAELGRVTAVRNRIAHGYATVDVDRIHAEVPAGLDALNRFAVAIAGHCGASPPSA